jgi:hypothetical protein
MAWEASPELLSGNSTPSTIETGNGGEPVGHSALFDERLIEALHVVERLVRSPEALAHVMEAAGPLALERAGAVLDERVPEAAG